MQGEEHVDSGMVGRTQGGRGGREVFRRPFWFDGAHDKGFVQAQSAYKVF